MKFPKFGRRKSVGTALEAGYEPAHQKPDEPEGRKSFSSANLFAFAHKGRVNSGHDSLGSSARLSSSSTVPSADFPHTPNSSDDFRAQRVRTYGPDSTNPYPPSTDSSASRPSSNRPYTPPRRKTMTATAPPRIETDLDSTPMFGDDLFSFSTSGGASELPQPKIARGQVLRTDSPDSYDSVHFQREKPLPSPLDPRRTIGNKSNEPPLPKIPNQHLQQNRLPLPHHLTTKLSFDDSGAEQALTAPHSTHPDHRTSRSLTPQAPPAKPARHDRNDSLNVVPRRGKQRQGSADSGLRRSSAFLRRSSVVEDEDANIVRRSIKRELQPPAPSKAGSTSTSSSVGLSPGGRDRDSGWEENVGSGNSSVHSFLESRRSPPPVAASGAAQKESSRPPVITVKALPTKAPSPKPQPMRPASPQSDDDDNMFDASLSASAAAASRYTDNPSSSHSTPVPKKVMSPAEFAQYQRQKAAEQDSESDSSEAEESEDDSDQEHRMKLAKQREKQDAHLSVFRQQVRKVTGGTGQLPPSASNGAFSRTNSAPLLNTLNNNASVPTFAISSSDPLAAEDDEDIPLGILQAHGFPSSTRPPSISRLQHTSSQPNLRASSAGLPVFARNLPADPYFGASLINAPARMSLAYGIGSDARSQATGSVYGERRVDGNAQPSKEEIKAAMRAPQGLIGEIALAEQQKEFRRGLGSNAGGRASPMVETGGGVGVLGMGGGFNPQNPGAGRPASMLPSLNQGMGMGAGGMLGMAGGLQLSPQPISPSTPSTNDPQAMHMQLQFQQMQLEMLRLQTELVRAQNGQASPAPSQQLQQQQQQQYLNPQATFANSRPMTMSEPLLSRPMSTYTPSIRSVAPPQQQGMMGGLGPVHQQSYPPAQISSMGPGMGRPVSFLPPQQMAFHQGGLISKAYTPSLAPSERSTIGQPSRYRPVSHMAGSVSGGSRTGTGISAAAALRGSGLRNRADEEEEEDWGAVKEKREKRRLWRRRKEEEK